MLERGKENEKKGEEEEKEMERGEENANKEEDEDKGKKGNG